MDRVGLAPLVDHVLRQGGEEEALLVLVEVPQGPPPAVSLKVYSGLSEEGEAPVFASAQPGDERRRGVGAGPGYGARFVTVEYEVDAGLEEAETLRILLDHLVEADEGFLIALVLLIR